MHRYFNLGEPAEQFGKAQHTYSLDVYVVVSTVHLAKLSWNPNVCLAISHTSSTDISST